MPRSRALRLSVLLASLATAAGAALVPAPAGAEDPPPWTVVASGLDNPRQLSFDRHGSLYVAEAGTGGSGPCQAGPEGDQVCFGTTGAISRVRDGVATRVASGFPSLAGTDGSAAIGPADVQVTGRHHYLVSIGLGAPPAVRADLPAAGRWMGTLTAGNFHGRARHVVADLAGYEGANDPDGAGPDSNPVGFSASRAGVVATDAGGNTLLRVQGRGHVSTLAVFGPRTVASPFPQPPTIDMQAVPTSVVRGPDGAWYVSQLTGFPFPAGGAQIFRVVPGQAPTVYATGLTNVTDLAWHDGTLYAVQLASTGLLAAGESLPLGSLVKVVPGGAPVPVAEDLPAPYGVAVRHDSAYVTTCSVCPGGGGVARIPLG